MKIYVAHASSFDFKKELYEPLRQSELNKQHDITLPHEKSDEPFDSKEFIKKCDLVVAEVSYPSTGMGIELGWADAFNTPIICIYKASTKPSASLHKLTNKVITYTDQNDLVSQLSTVIEQKKKA